MEINIFDRQLELSAVRTQVSAWTTAQPAGVGALPMQAQKLSVLTYGTAVEPTTEAFLACVIGPARGEKSALVASAKRGVDPVSAPQQGELQHSTASDNSITSGSPPRGRSA